MASWFRSQDMTYVSIIINEDAAHGCASDLGKMGVLQFTDLNPDLTPFQRRYVAYIKRIDELERKIKFFGEELKKFDITPVSNSIDGFVSTGGVGSYRGLSGAESGSGNTKSGAFLLESIEVELEGMEAQLVDLNKYSLRLTQEYNEKVEMQEVLLKTRGFFTSEAPKIHSEEAMQDARAAGAAGGGGGSTYQRGADEMSPPLLGGTKTSELRFSYIAGVVPVVDRSRFERQLFRSTRGNCYVRFQEIEDTITDPTSGEAVHKFVFIVFFKSTAIEGKISKICDAFGAKRYPIPNMEDGELVNRMTSDNYAEISDARLVLMRNRDARLELCNKLAESTELWKWTVLREKSIYHSLNMFTPDVRGMLRGEGWVAKDMLFEAQEAVRKAHISVDTTMPSFVEEMPLPWPTPPTYFRLNQFTLPFQEFVDTYGVPRYKEANPALFTAATFPFLYGVMYGDIGHGSCILLAGLYLVCTAHKVAGRRDMGELTGGMYMGRWMILMMGIFSVYCGLIYNDFFSLPLNMFGSSWTWPVDDALSLHPHSTHFSSSLAGASEAEGASTGDPAQNKSFYGDKDAVYPFGVDPAWHVAENELLFFNSMKMKMSVILGITQMTFGICLKASNARFFKQPLDFWFEFVPMIIFDMCLFGYMVILIFVKWGINWQDRMYSATCLDTGFTPGGLACTSASKTIDMCPLGYGGTSGGCQPPNLITTLINIALAPGSVDEPMYSGQAGLQTLLILLAVLCIPVILVGKPIMIKREMDRSERMSSMTSESHLMDEQGSGANANAGNHDHKDEHGDFSEIVIHQAIETIEFVLGMVSNTASYLRLWALSLAHTELAAVFWEKAMLASIEMGSPITIFVGYAVFACVTFGVLLCMDVLECFLHALRLHWVEFQNKFYKADGYKFMPFSFTAIINAACVTY